jgi:hypothetical protein
MSDSTWTSHRISRPKKASNFSVAQLSDARTLEKAIMLYRILLCCIVSLSSVVFAQSGPFGSHYESHIAGRPRVIVFVHGLYGDASGTWTASNKAYFPSLVAGDPTITQANVFVAGYHTEFTGQNHSIKQLTSDLFKELSDAKVFSEHKEFIFICHSLGGLVVDTMLIEHPEIASRVAYLQYFGTTHQGSFMASFRSIFGSDPLVTELKGGDGNDYLVELDKDWRNARYTFHRFCAVEGAGMLGHGWFSKNSVVVSYYSATYRCDASVPADMMPFDHLGIVKPSDRTAPAYLVFKRTYRENRFVTVEQVSRDASEYLTVDCEHTNSSPSKPLSVQLDPTFKERVVNVKTDLINQANIKDVRPAVPALVKIENNTAYINYGFNGLDRDFFHNCPGGGHATLIAHFTVERRVPVPDGDAN